MMICSNPYVNYGGMAFGCGQCNPCRSNRRRIWATRIMVEAAQYEDNAFVTCTYAPENDPGSLVPEHMKAFVKRLRANYDYMQKRMRVNDVKRLRFFGVGEYGEVNDAPHYHYMLFNFPTCVYRRSQYSKRRDKCCERCEMVRASWGQGHVFLGEVEAHSAEYVGKYVVKGMTRTDDERLRGRWPEFARMSLKPGIGADAMFDVAHTMLNYQNTLDTLDDVPNALMVGRGSRPIGRYLQRKLRTMVGRDEKAPQVVLDKIAAELRPVQMAAIADKANPSFKKRLIMMGEGRRASMRSRRQIYSKRSVL